MSVQIDDSPAGWPPAVRRRYPHRYAVLDVETTGLVPEVDRVLQVAVTLVDTDGVAERSWSSLVNPQRDPGPAHVHGFTAERLRTAPTFDGIAGELAALLAGRVLVAHNAQFDWSFLSEEMRRSGTSLDVDRRVCTRALAKRLDLPLVNLKLATLAAHWRIPQYRAHDAEDDVRVLVEVFRRQVVAAAEVALDLPLTPCTASARAAQPVRSTSTVLPTRAVRPPRVECPWALPPRWTPGSPLVQGHRIVVSGALDADRADLYARAVAAGLDAKNGVSRATAVIVTNDRGIRTRKVLDASAYGVPLIDEREFERLLRAVAPGVPLAGAVVAAPVTPPVGRTVGPFSRRRVLVLGGPHAVAAQVRESVVARGGVAAVRLTMSVTEFVALAGAEADPRWARIQELGLARLDHETWERAGGTALVEEAAVEPVVLPRGGTTDLPADQTEWHLDVSWRDTGQEVDVVALRLDDQETVSADEDLVFYGAPATPDGSVVVAVDTPGEAEVSIDLGRLPADTDRVLVAAALPEGVTFGEVGAVELTLRSPDGTVFARATLDAGTVEQTLVLGQVYRRGGVWRFRAQGQGYETGLAELVTRYGVDVEG
jgi:DNA polymerase-3 subunit epsilon